MIRFKILSRDIRMHVGAAAPVDMGRYYIPDVSKEGILSWLPSVPGMEEVEPENIKGPAFTYEDFTPEQLEELRGKSGVYVGSGEMPEGYDVQIDPFGLPTDMRGKLVFVDYTGAWAPLTIGPGLKVVNGVLMVGETDTTAMLGDAVLGNMILGA